jgi:predicted Holliday junction resolvase-like endonuclease
MYAKAYSIQQNAALVAAIQGEAIFAKTTYPGLPHFAYNPKDVREFMKMGLPCILVPEEIGKCIMRQ